MNKSLTQTMDSRDHFFSLLLSFEREHGFIPLIYKNDKAMMHGFDDYKKNGSWRNNPDNIEIINKAMGKIKKNNINILNNDKSLGIKKRHKSKSKNTKRIYKNIRKARKEIKEVRNK